MSRRSVAGDFGESFVEYSRFSRFNRSRTDVRDVNDFDMRDEFDVRDEFYFFGVIRFAPVSINLTKLCKVLGTC